MQLKCSSPSGDSPGFSLVELLVVIGIIGILAAMAMVGMSGVTDGAREAVVKKQCEEINSALKTFGQSMWDIRTIPDNASTDDELKVLHTIQYKPASGFAYQPGAPFYTQQWNPTGSSNSAHYRLRWTGSCFEVLKPGVAGSGLYVARDGSDYAAAFTYPNNYKMEGDPRP